MSSWTYTQGGVVVRERHGLIAAVADAEGVFAADAPDVCRMPPLAVDVDILRAAVAPAVLVVEQPDAVDEAGQRARALGVQQQVLLP